MPARVDEVARRVDRTPGSTRDYLRWLEEVDLIASRERRYGFVDPLLRVWTRIYWRGTPARDVDVEREVDRYLETLAPFEEPAFTLPAARPREDFID